MELNRARKCLRAVCKVLAAIAIVTAFALAQEQQQAEEEEVATPWTASFRGGYLSNSLKSGVNLSSDQATLGFSASLSHENGFYSSAGLAAGLGSPRGVQSRYFSVGYDYSMNDNVTLGIEFTHTKYADDSLNAVASLPNAVLFSASVDIWIVSLGASYNRYLGGNGANYFGFDISHYSKWGNLSIAPSAEVSYMSQQVSVSSLKLNAKKAAKLSAATVTNVRGLSAITFSVGLGYDCGGGIKASFTPSYDITPKSEVASKGSEFTFSLGLRYSKDF